MQTVFPAAPTSLPPLRGGGMPTYEYHRMNLTEYASYDALDLADLVRRREVAPRELCDLALQAIEKLNPQLNAVIETFPVRADSVPAPGPFTGVPFLVKDFPIEAGVKAEMGSQLAAGFAPAR